MEKILLVEPNYKNKYPPIGLMKISHYYKAKGDFVQFHKGLLPTSEVSFYDKVLITTLFTFDFDMCVKTIKYYIAIVGAERVFVGGIAATIMPEKFIKEIPNINLLKGQLTSSSVLGYDDDINIDILPLDYDMLLDIEYDYPAADSYFIYTSRGCPRKCTFCAVQKLEPEFYDCQNVEDQVSRVDNKYGIKRNLLIMDNNILYSSKYEETINVLEKIGFGISNNTCKKNNNIRFYLESISKRIEVGKNYDCLLNRIKKEFLGLKFRRISNNDQEKLKVLIESINEGDNRFVEELLKEKKYLVDFFDRYHYHKIKRFVDFNQGLDARLFSEEKAKIMAKIAVRPCRIAFDHIETQDTYLQALENAAKYGIKEFSNYLLYNFKDKPEDLWTRLAINIDFCEKHNDKNVSLFSFPMKYAAIDKTDRNYVGENWCRKFLRSINVILNVTSGVVTREKDFFERAYGKNPDEFRTILTMPDDFIRYRDFFEKNGLTNKWKEEYNKLSNDKKEQLLYVLSQYKTDIEAFDKSDDTSLKYIMEFYSIKKKEYEKNELFYKRKYSL